MSGRCEIHGCPAPADPAAPLALCVSHLIQAHDWVVEDVGVTDLLPFPCVACGNRVGVHYPSGWICARCEWRSGEYFEPDNRVHVDVVYYIRQRDRIKIGTSATPRARLAALHFDELLAFERGDRAVEHRRHGQFAAHRFPGTEWFAVHDELVAHIAELAAGVDDPWARYELWLSRELARRG
ncbi:MAG: GIY-YIG nuclease family protein [Salinibacterium sp.]|nr:GIY-YIG nuclease family protein [Salinibacterium sp.]